MTLSDLESLRSLRLNDLNNVQVKYTKFEVSIFNSSEFLNFFENSVTKWMIQSVITKQVIEKLRF